MGSNSFKEHEDDQECKARYVHVSVTAVEDNSSINMKFGAHNFAQRPIMRVTRTGARMIAASTALLASAVVSMLM